MIPAATRCGRQLRRRVRPLVARAAATPGADRYRKHFPAPPICGSCSSTCWTGLPACARPTRGWPPCPVASAASGCRRGISRSQLARSSTSRDPACAERLFAEAVAAVRGRAADPLWRRLARVQVVDSSFLALSATLSPWSRARRPRPRRAAAARLRPGRRHPAALRLTLADTHDTTALRARDLGALAGWTLLIDLGYYGHRLFAELRAAGASLICRLHPQAAYVIAADHPVPPITTPDGDVVLADQTITLGSPNNRAGAVLPGMRLITSRNPRGEVQRFVTDRVDLSAADIVALYRKRWQIELFFRWLKHQLALIRPFGTSREAVWLTVLTCAVVALLLALTESARPPGPAASSGCAA